MDKSSKNEEIDNKVKELQNKCEEYLNGWKRAQADYQNLEKETSKRIAQIMEISASGFGARILPIIDSFELAISHLPPADKDKEWMKGFFQIKKQFDELLREIEIRKIESVGRDFDHGKHEAIGSEESEKKPGEIVKEAQSGYMYKDKILRPAKVIVSK